MNVSLMFYFIKLSAFSMHSFAIVLFSSFSSAWVMHHYASFRKLSILSSSV